MKIQTSLLLAVAAIAATLIPHVAAQNNAEIISRQYEALRSAENIQKLKAAHTERGSGGYFPMANELDMQVLQNLVNADAAYARVNRKGPPPPARRHAAEMKASDLHNVANEAYADMINKRRSEREAENAGGSLSRERIDFTKHIVSQKEIKDRMEMSARERRQADGDQLRMGIVRDADNGGLSSLYRKFNKGTEGHGETNIHPYDKRVLDYFAFIKSQQHVASDGSVYDPVAPVRGVDANEDAIDSKEVAQVVSPFSGFGAYVGMDGNTNALEVALGVTWGLILLCVLLAAIVFFLRRWREKRPEDYQSITDLSKSGTTTKRTTGYELMRDTEDSKANDGNVYY
ncbi:hypothetical protein SARC_01979 [Sphaeroforma arctica JP610]|uniref:Uncharacterized protein n=1 Tax=Sphaeroforma arctica JP610 TaxID=667725 RepID=A0A0L0GA43_9EUKA|nr:hypothetical protein SARC_01979 [Sphaeroforma arctica JP610]KNC85870.1 hypothetical protein SARC_01979 [Sphaeroforma arctica JP610]|eukprot:XP_014159772.1 hypothetical protein SARC_01979 [Sphaeroforma arctica JP610]